MAASFSPIPYTGNKGCIARELLSFIPPHMTYVEPCAGSAEIFFRKAPSRREILNDYSNDITNLFRSMQSEEKLQRLLGRLCLSIPSERLFKENKKYLESIPNVLDDLKETLDMIKNAQEANIEQAAAFMENQVYSFSSTGQSYGIEARDMTKRIKRLIAARSRILGLVEIPDIDPDFEMPCGAWQFMTDTAEPCEMVGYPFSLRNISAEQLGK